MTEMTGKLVFKKHLTVCTPKDAQRLPTWGSFYSSIHWKNKVLPKT